MSDVFVSHVEEDAAVALDIAVGLEEAGFCTWCYEIDSIPGGSYLLQTARGIERARLVLVLISPASLGQVQVTKEIVRAHEADRPFLPVLHGVSHAEFQARAPEWRQAMGAAVSVTLGADGVAGLLPTIHAALEELHVPHGVPPRERIARLARQRDARRWDVVETAPPPGEQVSPPSAGSRSLGPTDVALLGLVPVALFALAAYTWQLAGGGLAWVGVYVGRNSGAGGPVVRGFWPGEAGAGLRRGDVLVRLDDTDLAGYGPLRLFTLAQARRRRAGTVPVVYQRAGVTAETPLPFVPVAYPWRILPLALALLGIGTLTLLRRPRDALARLFFLSVTLFGIHWTCFFGGPEWLSTTWAVVFALSSTMMFPLILQLAAATPEGIMPLPGVRWWSWLFALMGPLVVTAVFGVPLPPALGLPGMWAMNVLFIVGLLGILTANYRRATAIGRRQVKWILYGLYVGLAPVLVADAVASFDGRWWWLHDLAAVCEVAIPAGFLVALVRFNFLDVDRLISATVVNSVLGFLFFLVTLVGVPRAAEATGTIMGLDPTFAGWLLTAIIAAPLYPAYTYLRPRVDRRLFAERYALEQGIDVLLDALGGRREPDALLRLAGQRLHDLLRPETCEVYAQRDATFERVFSVRRRGASVASPAFRGEDAALAILARQPAVVDLQGRRARVAGTTIDVAERRALAPLGATLVIVIRRSRDLAGFVCLGPKASGDVYTSTELGLLRTVQEKLSGELLRLELGRHVPAQVVELLARDPKRLQPTWQDITVLHATLEAPAAAPVDQAARLRDEAVEAVTAAIAREEGLLDVAMGGQLRAVWNAPIRISDHAGRACRAALAMRDAIDVLAARAAERGWPAIELRIGLSSGSAMVGNLPLGGRFHYTAEGPCVDLAARLDRLNTTYGTHVLLTADTRTALAGDFIVREIDRVLLDDDGTPVAVHELLGTPAADADGRRRRLEDVFSRALAAYRAGDLRDAAERFAKLAAEFPDDGPARLYAGRARETSGA